MSQGPTSPGSKGLSPDECERRMKNDPGSLYNMNRIAYLADGTPAFPEFANDSSAGVPVMRSMQDGFVCNINHQS